MEQHRKIYFFNLIISDLLKVEGTKKFLLEIQYLLINRFFNMRLSFCYKMGYKCIKDQLLVRMSSQLEMPFLFIISAIPSSIHGKISQVSGEEYRNFVIDTKDILPYFFNMSKPYSYLGILLLLLLKSFDSISQSDWTKKMDSQKEFIENKGQFSFKELSPDKVKYVCQTYGVNIVLTSSGIHYSHYETKIQEKKEHLEEELKKLKGKNISHKTIEKEKERESKQIKSKYHDIGIEWEKANENCEIIAEQKVANYYTYYSVTDKVEYTANAFKKVTYKNIYPHIDLEYILMDEKEGLKYNFILHPGADPSLIQMKVKGDNPIIDLDGNLHYKLFNKDIIEQAPQSFYQDGTKIKSSFKKNGNRISFKLGSYDNSKLVIIDPWTVTPNFTPTVGAYNLEYDNQGNVYVQGGGQSSGYGNGTASQIKKFDASGNLIWTHNPLSLGFFGLIEDIAVDKSTGICYYTLFSYSVCKISSTGTIMAAYTENSIIILDFFNIKYNQCTNKIYVGCGLSLDFNNTQILTFTPSLTSPIASSIYGPISTAPDDCDDLEIVNSCLDDQGQYYYTISQMPDGNVSIPMHCDLSKSNVTNFSSTPFSAISTGYKYGELSSMSFQNNQRWSGTLNGICVSSKNIYSSDGYTLKKWDNQTGALLNTVSMGTEQQWPSINGYNQVTKIISSGIDNDDFENIYVGFEKTIRKYDCNMDLAQTYTLPDTVYEIRISDDNTLLYASGKNFVTQTDLSLTTIFSVDYINPTSCGQCDGKAFLSSTLCEDAKNNFSYSWNTTPPQTSDTAFNLCPGTYTVTVTKNNCSPVVVFTGTVTITGNAGAPILTTLTSTPSSCINQNGTATVTVSGGTPNYSYSWDTNPVQNGSTAIDLPTGMVTVTVTDAAGCEKKDSILIDDQNTLVLTMTSSAIDCSTNLGTASVTVQNGLSPYSYQWSTGESISAISTSTAGIVTVLVTDQNGCTATSSISIDPSPNFSITASSNSPICENEDLILTAICQDQSATFNWTGPNNFTSIVQNPTITDAITLNSGQYTVEGTVAGCSSTDTILVDIIPLPDIQFSADKIVGCDPLTVEFTDLSTPPGTSISWDFGDGNISFEAGNVSHIYDNSGSFDVTLTSNSNGCTASNSQTNFIQVNDNATTIFTASPLVTDIFNTSISFTNNSLNATMYTWDFGDHTNSSEINPEHIYPSEANEYTVSLIANNLDDCPDTNYLTIIITEPLLFYVPNTFTPDGNSYNETFQPIFTSGYDLQDFKFSIFNRWGELIIDFKEPTCGWDGRHNGKIVEDGTYVWKLHLKDKVNDKKYEFTGHVNVLR